MSGGIEMKYTDENDSDFIDLDKQIESPETSIKNKKPKKKGKVRKFFKWVGIVFLVGFLLAVIAVIAVAIKAKPLIDSAKITAYEKMANIDKNTFMLLEDTKVFDASGTQIGEINISNFQYAEISEISKYIQDGYIAVEDVRFMTHNGIDLKAIARAGVSLIKNKGSVTQGGSTITQQVLKNNVIGTDIGIWDRKILEIFLAPEFEKMFSKADIMEFYCNSNFYSNNCYGVETASQYYFGKSAKDVTLAEAALIVGISNNPSRYNPVKHPDAAIEKRQFVLSRMLEEEKITQAEFDEANKEELTLVLSREKRGKESYMVSYALYSAALKLMEIEGFEFKYTFKTEEEYKNYKEAYSDLYGEMANKVRGGGYEIYTSLDTVKQAKLQEILDNMMKGYKEKSEDGRFTMQSAATIVDNNTGYVVAIVGGRGTEDEYNRGYQGFRQPGSSIKPLVSYAPAFETGEFYPSLKIKDEKVKNGPNNVNNRFIGNISIREAIARSTNTIAFKVLQEITPEVGVSYLGKLHFRGLSYMDTYNGSMALGGFTYGTTTVEMAKGYSTLVTAGTYSDNTCLKKLVYQDGKTLYEEETKYTQVYTPDTAYLILDCLKGVMNESYGTGTAMKVPGQVVVGKTGTTDSKKDGWFCGASDYYSMAVWCGYDQPKPIPAMAGGKYPGQIFKQMMVYLHDGLAETDFEQPETVVEYNVDHKGNIVDYKSGNTDLFSQTAIDRAEEQQRIESEKEQKEAEEKSRKAEDEKVIQLKNDIESFGTTIVESESNVYSMDKQYRALKKSVNNLEYSTEKQLLLNKIEEYYKAINNMESTIEFRAAIREKERLAAEIEAENKRIEEEANAAIKRTNIEAANAALLNLSEWIMHPEYAYTMLDATTTAVEACKEYTEYEGLSAQLDTQAEAINNYFNPQTTPDQWEVIPTPEIETEQPIGEDIDGDGVIMPGELAA